MRPRISVRLFVLLTVLLCLFNQSALSQDWTQWRGANRDGVLSGFTEPNTWPQQLTQQWKVTVGEGASSPLVAGNRVYQFARQGNREMTTCLDLNSGKQLWQDGYDVTYKLSLSTTVIVGKHKQGPRSTPVLSNGKLYTFGIGGVLSCYDANNGKLLWRNDSSQQYKDPAPYYGQSMSPLVDRGLVIVHLGGHGSGALTAFDANTGAVKWQWNGDGPGNASPIVVEIAGTRQIITQSQDNLISIWPDNGGLLWKIPFTTEYEQNIVTPLVYKDTLIFSGLDKGVFAIRPKYANGQWTTEQLWKNDEAPMYMTSPILSGNLLFGMTHKNKGQFFCLDANNGKTLWKGAPRQGENAAMMVSGNLMFWLNNSAELIVVRAAAQGYQELKRYMVADSETWAHPAIVGNRVLIKDNRSLAMWSLE